MIFVSGFNLFLIGEAWLDVNAQNLSDWPWVDLLTDSEPGNNFSLCGRLGRKLHWPHCSKHWPCDPETPSTRKILDRQPQHQAVRPRWSKLLANILDGHWSLQPGMLPSNHQCFWMGTGDCKKGVLPSKNHSLQGCFHPIATHSAITSAIPLGRFWDSWLTFYKVLVSSLEGHYYGQVLLLSPCGRMDALGNPQSDPHSAIQGLRIHLEDVSKNKMIFSERP